jgi:hypothetical protein
MRQIKSARQISCAFVIVCLWLISCNANAQQKLPRAGRAFTFGIIEGPDNLSGGGSSLITLTVLSPYAGSGIVASPKGFAQQFTFVPNTATILVLPDSLMHLNDLGKTTKGIQVHTTEPVNLVLHDYLTAAGDATQILPDEALDTSYLISEWGIFNDVSEDNHSEFIVTAKQEATAVTIMPSETTMLGQAAGVPFSVVLNTGECYIVKSDISAGNLSTTLSGSTVSSSKPVSVIVGTTCAYVPLGVESCNELMDELLGKKWWGDHFFVQPLGNLDSVVQLVVTSDKSFSVQINGANSISSAVGKGNQLQAQITGAGEIVASTPVELQQLTQGSTFAVAGISDPTLVTILDTSEYSDTMMFYSPTFSGSSFQDWAPIIFPTSKTSTIFLDGLALSSYPETSTIIHGSAMSAVNPSIGTGVHTIISPVPVFALGTGFDIADAYSFVAGTTLPYIQAEVTPNNPVNSVLSLSVFPNPAMHYITIVPTEPLVSVQLFDPLGRVIKTILHPPTPFTFDVSTIPAGSYFIIAKTNDANIESRVQVIH